MGSFDYLESTATLYQPRPLTLSSQQGLMTNRTKSEGSHRPAPWAIRLLLLRTLLLALCFPFWTFAVGGCMLLSPTTHLDAIGFGFVLPPPSDVARFGYWPENAIPHMSPSSLVCVSWFGGDLTLDFQSSRSLFISSGELGPILSWTRIYPWVQTTNKRSIWSPWRILSEMGIGLGLVMAHSSTFPLASSSAGACCYATGHRWCLCYYSLDEGCGMIENCKTLKR